MDIFQVTVTKPLYGGKGLAFLDGKALFVDQGVPGEQCAVRITSTGKDYDCADVVDILRPSGLRQHPPCPNFGRCGGCSYLHVAYDGELAMKKDIVLDCLERIAGMRRDHLPRIEIVFAERFGYRSHASLKAGAGIVGLYRSGSDEIVALPPRGCLLLAPEITAALREPGLPSEDSVSPFRPRDNAVSPAGAIRR